MQNSSLKVSRILYAVLPLLAAFGCSRTNTEAVHTSSESTRVSIQVARPEAKSHIAGDGLSVDWDNNDKLYLWAVDGSGRYYFENLEFRMFGMYSGRAVFTADLPEDMPEDRYTYYACSPAPKSFSLRTAEFEINGIQDGCGGGIMISTPCCGTELRPAAESASGKNVRLEMNQMLHLLKLYVNDSGNLLNGESIERIELCFPQSVTGILQQDIFDPSEKGVFTGYGNDIMLELKNPIAASSATEKNYAYATIPPTVWNKSAELKATLYSATRFVKAAAVNISGRDMQAGHATPIRLATEKSGELYRINIRLTSNPLGEKLKSITLTAPAGCKWGDEGSNVYTITENDGIDVGMSCALLYTNMDNFLGMSGKSIRIDCESDHVSTGIDFTFPDLTGKSGQDINIDVPALLCEDFSNLETFSSYDEYSDGFNSGDKSACKFLNGWTGGRVGGKQGKCIRIACRRETSADYNARVDSAPLSGKLKKGTRLKVEFSYGANNKFGGIPIVTDGNVGQTVYVGYVTSTSGYSSGSEDGTYQNGNSLYVKEYTGTYDNTPNDIYYIIDDAPVNSTVRISWRSVIEHQAGTTNTTCWFYIDNIKVTVAE